MAEFTEKNIKLYATIFAEAFKRQGVMCANTSTLENTGGVGVQQDNSFTEFKERKAQRKLLQQNNKLLDEYLDIQEDINKSKGDEEKLSKRRKQIEKDLQDGSIMLGKSYISAVTAIKSGDYKSQDIKAFTANEDLSKLSQTFGSKINEAGNVMSESIEQSAEQIYTKTSRAISKIFSVNKTKGLLTASFAQFMLEFKTGLKYGADTNRSFWDSHVNALKMGISPSDLIELEAKNKRLINAMGGADNFEDAMGTASLAAYKYYGDLGEATKSTTQAMQALTLGGVNPTEKTMIGQNGELAKMNKLMNSTRIMTGQTFSEQNAAMEEYIKSDSIKSKLVTKSSSAERMAIIQKGIANREYLASLGLTADQADRLAASFNGVVGMDPKERLKESYKAQAVMSALGIEGAKEFGEVIRAGGFNAAGITDEIRNKALKAAEVMSKKEASSRSGAITGNNLMVSQLSKTMSAFGDIMKSSQELSLANEEAAKRAKKKAEDDKERDANPIKNFIKGGITTGLMVANIISTGITANSLLTGILGLVGIIALGVRRGAKAGRGKPKSYDDLKTKNKPKGGIFKRGKDKVSAIKDRAAARAKDLGTKGKGLYGKAVEGISKTKGGDALKAGKNMMVKGAGGIMSSGKSILKFGGRLLGKAALPVAALMSITDGISGWREAAKNFKGKEITTGMKAASALGGVISGLSLGFIDSANIAKSAYGLFVDAESDKAKVANKPKVLNNNPTNPVQPLNKTKQHSLEKKDSRKKESDNNKMILMQEQMIALQQQNSELMKMTNEILENNFEKIHVSNNKYLKSSTDIKTVLESNIDDGLVLSSFDDNSFSFV